MLTFLTLWFFLFVHTFSHLRTLCSSSCLVAHTVWAACINQPLFQFLATQQQSAPSAPIPLSSRELQVSLVFIVSATYPSVLHSHSPLHWQYRSQWLSDQSLHGSVSQPILCGSSSQVYGKLSQDMRQHNAHLSEQHLILLPCCHICPQGSVRKCKV